MSPAEELALKLFLTPVLVGTASLAGRRWGSSVGGWLIGIPFTSGPVAFFLALDPGPRFAAAAAAGTMAGAMSQAAFCVAFAWAARRSGWAPSLLAATAGFALATGVLALWTPAVGLTFALIIVVLVASLLITPKGDGPASQDVRFPKWDLPARMLVATGFVVVLTGAAPLLGPRLAGLLAPFPLYGAVLAGFAHELQGAGAAVAVVRGLLLGLFAFAGFFLVLALLLPASVALAFGAAIVVAIAVQSVSLLFVRRARA